MSIEKTLKKIEAEINAGDLGKARDRLHGLISTYPDDLTLRKRLGDIYWQLRYPTMGGRYWYLEENKSVDMNSACEKFEKSFHNDPFQILCVLKYRGDIDNLVESYVGNILVELQARAKSTHLCNYRFGKKKGERFEYDRRSILTRFITLTICCIIISVMLLIVIMVGFLTIIEWLF